MAIYESEIDALNAKIGGEYVTIDGHKIFRLVWSESIFENRYGTFREFTEGGLFIREVTETRRVRKYNYIHNRWIFEMWAPGNMVANRETPDAINGDYVPVYVFEDRHGSYLPPNEKVVRFLIAALHGKIQRDEIPSQEYLEAKEIERTVEEMDDHPSWFQTRPGDARNAIFYKGGLPGWHVKRTDFIKSGAVAAIEQKELEEKRRIREIEENRARVKEAREREREREKDILRRNEIERMKVNKEELIQEQIISQAECAGEAARNVDAGEPQSPMHKRR